MVRKLLLVLQAHSLQKFSLFNIFLYLNCFVSFRFKNIVSFVFLVIFTCKKSLVKKWLQMFPALYTSLQICFQNILSTSMQWRLFHLPPSILTNCQIQIHLPPSLSSDVSLLISLYSTTCHSTKTINNCAKDHDHVFNEIHSQATSFQIYTIHLSRQPIVGGRTIFSFVKYSQVCRRPFKTSPFCPT